MPHFAMRSAEPPATPEPDDSPGAGVPGSPRPAEPADVRPGLDREVAAAVAPLSQVLTLSHEASTAMRAELERLEARFKQIKSEAAHLAVPAADTSRADAAAHRLQQVCEQVGAVEQRLIEATAEVGHRVEELEVRGGRLMRSCDQIAARHDELARAGEQQRGEIERISEMPLARIEAAADAAAARLESLIENATTAASRFERAAREHATSELTMQEAAARLAPWQGVLDGSTPGPVEDLTAAMRAEIRQEMNAVGAGLAQLASAVARLAEARNQQPAPRRKAAPAAPKPAAPSPAAPQKPATTRRKATQQVEAKPGRSSPAGRAATSMKSAARGSRKKSSKRTATARSTSGTAARRAGPTRSRAKPTGKAAARSASSRQPATPCARAASRRSARKTAASRR